MANLEVDVLLEHIDGEKDWSASVPGIEGCLASGPTAQEAAQAIVPEVQYFAKHEPESLQILSTPREFLLSKVNVPIDNG